MLSILLQSARRWSVRQKTDRLFLDAESLPEYILDWRKDRTLAKYAQGAPLDRLWSKRSFFKVEFASVMGSVAEEHPNTSIASGGGQGTTKPNIRVT